MDEEKFLKDEIVMDMLSNYTPTPLHEEADEEMTTQEIVDKFSETIEVSNTYISMMMKKLGFRMKLRCGIFRWQMNFAE